MPTSYKGFPRARGDAPAYCVAMGDTWMVPPRTRGCALPGLRGSAHRQVPPRTRGCARCETSQRRVNRGSPAHAGMRPQLTIGGKAPIGFPRARGDAPPKGH